MQVTEVRAVQPIAPNSPADWRTSLGQMLVAVDTDKGLTGYGVGGGGLAGIHVVRTVLRDVLLGKDPAPVERHWQAMYNATLPFGRKGLAIMALSGVDLALWDLRGKANRQSVAQLLGGLQHRRMPTYCTVWDELPAEVAGKFPAYKLHVGHAKGGDDISATVQTIEQARSRIGPDCPLMIDAWMLWDLATTLKVANETANCRLNWIEEPLPVDDVAGYVELARRCPVPIAGGEHEFTAIGFAEVI